jgi:hypothetical protein
MLELDSLRQSLDQITGALAPEKALFRQKEQLNSLELVFEEIKKKFKNAGSPPQALALKAASRFLAGDESLDEVDVDLIAFALAKPVGPILENTLFNDEARLKALLDNYSAKCAAAQDMLITWRGVMGTYFELSPNNSPNRQQFERSLEDVRHFLFSTWGSVKKSTELRLSWMKAIDENIELLSPNPCDQLAKRWFDGHEDLVLKISGDLQIPSNSWFWERLFITCLQNVLNFDEFSFKKAIPKLLELFDKHKIYRDKGLGALFDRYAICSDTSVNETLKEYALDLWASPEGHDLAGSKWKLISKPALAMVINWVHETNLRLFFKLLKERGHADDDRLNFWLKFIPQVTSSRLALGPTSQRLVESRADYKKVFKREGSAYSQLREDQNPDNDAFLMTIGNCLIIDFSIGGGCYVYRHGENKFDIKDKYHYSSTSRKGLKEKYRTQGMDFAHTPGWMDAHRAPAKLRKEYGITPSAVRLIEPSNSIQKINVRDYFSGGHSPLPEEGKLGANYSKVEIPTFVPPKLEDVIALQDSASSSNAPVLFKYFEAKAKAIQIAKENGIEFKEERARLLVKHMRDKGPIAEKLSFIGLKFINGIGWTLE